MILILVLERLSITPLLSVSTASLAPSLILSASVSFMYFCNFGAAMSLPLILNRLGYSEETHKQ